MERKELGLSSVEKLLFEVYIPFVEEKRAIPWPPSPERMENDAEHSYSLALVGSIIASELGLDANRAASLAVVHDLVEVYAGDTSAWDEEGLQDKAKREAAALEKLKSEFRYTWLSEALDEYEELESEESRLVYALDKLLAVLVLMEGGGLFWKQNGITFKDHHKKYQEKRQQVEKHPVILEWYDEVHRELENKKDLYFSSSTKDK